MPKQWGGTNQGQGAKVLPGNSLENGHGWHSRGADGPRETRTWRSNLKATYRGKKKIKGKRSTNDFLNLEAFYCRSWAGIKEQAINHTMYNQNQCITAVPVNMHGIMESLSIAEEECILYIEYNSTD